MIVCDPQKQAEFIQQHQGQAKSMSPLSTQWDPGSGTTYPKQLLAPPISAHLILN